MKENSSDNENEFNNAHLNLNTNDIMDSITGADNIFTHTIRPLNNSEPDPNINHIYNTKK